MYNYTLATQMSMDDMDFKDTDTYKASVLLWQFMSLPILIFGTIGNTLTIIVLLSKRTKKSSTSIFLTALAFADMLALLAGLPRFWALHVLNVDIQMDTTSAGCNVLMFVSYLANRLSPWILVCVTLDRCLSVWLPHRKIRLCGDTKTVLFILATILVSLSILLSPFLYGLHEIEQQVGNVTKLVRGEPLNAKYKHYFSYVFPWINLIITALIPFIIIITGNTLVLFKVIKSSKRFRRVSVSSLARSTVTRRPRSKQTSITITVVAVCVVFIICTMPLLIYDICKPYWDKNKQSARLKGGIQLFEACSFLLFYINNSINFVLYCFSSIQFRTDLKELFPYWTCTSKLKRQQKENQSNLVVVQICIQGRTTAL